MISDDEFRKWREESGLDEAPAQSNVIQLYRRNTDGYGYPEPMWEVREDPPIEQYAWSTFWPDLDYIWRLYPGQLTVVTGLAGSGKSLFLFNVLLQMAIEDGFHSTFWIPENERHIKQIVRRMYRWGLPENADAATRYVLENQWFYQPSSPDFYDREPQDIVTVLDRIGTTIDQNEIAVVVLDPWNELERAKPKEMMLTDYIGDCLMYAKRWARQWRVALIIVAHPTKAVTEGGGRSVALYDIEGSMNWFNKCDNGLIIQRESTTNVTTVLSAKVREIGAGRIGRCQFQVDPQTGIFTPFEGSGVDGLPEKTRRNKRNS